MLMEALDNLQHVVILNEKNVQDLRRYIQNKYPSYGPESCARIFASTIYRILDGKLLQFTDQNRNLIKKQLLAHVISKKEFSIHADDILKASISASVDNNEYIQQMTDWLSHFGDMPLEPDSVGHYVSSIKKVMGSATASLSTIEAVAETLQDGEPVASESFNNNITSVEDYPTLQQEAPAQDASALLIPSGNNSLSKRDNGMVKTFTKNLNNLLKLPKRKGLALFTAGSLAVALTIFILYPYVFKVNFPSDNRLKTVYAKSDVSDTPVAEANPSMPSGKAAAIRIIQAEATAYDLSYESCGKHPNHPAYGLTFTGTKATKGRTVAVDPKVIPLGSKVYITFPTAYKHMNGQYIAEDTGNLITGNRIDIFLGEDRPGESGINKKAKRFGVQPVTVELYAAE